MPLRWPGDLQRRKASPAGVHVVYPLSGFTGSSWVVGRAAAAYTRREAPDPDHIGWAYEARLCGHVQMLVSSRPGLVSANKPFAHVGFTELVLASVPERLVGFVFTLFLLLCAVAGPIARRVHSVESSPSLCTVRRLYTHLGHTSFIPYFRFSDYYCSGLQSSDKKKY